MEYFDQIEAKIETGDLLFQEITKDDIDEAVKKVTPSYKGIGYNHVGIAYRTTENQLHVIEAVPKGVIMNSLSDFLSKNINPIPAILVGRLKNKFKHLIPKAINHILVKVGYPYNHSFILENNGYYCSELIYEAFKYANNDTPVFPLQPMTFKDKTTGEPNQFWIQYYKKLNMSIPEGKPGINPGILLNSDKLDIIQFN